MRDKQTDRQTDRENSREEKKKKESERRSTRPFVSRDWDADLVSRFVASQQRVGDARRAPKGSVWRL